jgi:hypothetical protein
MSDIKNNVSTVRSIGAGVRLTETAVPEILASLPVGFDHTARGAIADAVHAWACGDAKRPAVRTGKAGEQVTTDYGRGHETLVKAVKRALNDGADKPVTLRATLSGEGGGSVTIPTDHALYAALVDLIKSSQEA